MASVESAVDVFDTAAEAAGEAAVEPADVVAAVDSVVVSTGGIVIGVLGVGCDDRPVAGTCGADVVFAEVAATCGDDVLHAVTATQSPPASTVRMRPVRMRPVRMRPVRPVPNRLRRDVVVDFIGHPLFGERAHQHVT